MVDVDAALQTQIRNIETTYGRPLAHWFGVIDDSGLTKHTEVVALLKTEHAMTHGAAHRVSLLARSRADTKAAGGLGEATDQLYTGRKSGLRPLHERLMAAVNHLGPVEVVAKKGYLSLRRRTQFAMIQPSAAGRIDLGLKLPGGYPVTDRLESAATFNALFTHRVRVHGPDDLDPQLLGWLHDAYIAAR